MKKLLFLFLCFFVLGSVSSLADSYPYYYYPADRPDKKDLEGGEGRCDYFNDITIYYLRGSAGPPRYTAHSPTTSSGFNYGQIWGTWGSDYICSDDLSLPDSFTLKISAGNGDDVVHGTDKDDEIHGNGAFKFWGINFWRTGQHGNRGRQENFKKTDNDKIFGKKGNDRIEGNDGNDRLFGNEGNDTINGNDGNDRIHGGEGNDYIKGGDGHDTLIGGGGNDLFYSTNWEAASQDGKTDVILDFSIDDDWLILAGFRDATLNVPGQNVTYVSYHTTTGKYGHKERKIGYIWVDGKRVETEIEARNGRFFVNGKKVFLIKKNGKPDQELAQEIVEEERFILIDTYFHNPAPFPEGYGR